MAFPITNNIDPFPSIEGLCVDEQAERYSYVVKDDKLKFGRFCLIENNELVSFENTTTPNSSHIVGIIERKLNHTLTSDGYLTPNTDRQVTVVKDGLITVKINIPSGGVPPKLEDKLYILASTGEVTTDSSGISYPCRVASIQGNGLYGVNISKVGV